ncbi:MAG: hypothetical protein JO290_00965 [Sphingomonadaceae bacterium]|nr:hypothetical protein [Sphingomonadaceae bacterium]
MRILVLALILTSAAAGAAPQQKPVAAPHRGRVAAEWAVALAAAIALGASRRPRTARSVAS